MVKSYNYYGLYNDISWHFRVYKNFSQTNYYPVLFRTSKNVWLEGPRGGIILIMEKNKIINKYITKNENRMKEFCWIKLQSKTIT